MEKDKKKNPAIENGCLALIQKREKLLDGIWRVIKSFAGGMYHKISHGHLTTGNKSGDARNQSEGDQESANELNPSPYQHHSLTRAVASRWEPEKFLAAVTGEHQAYDQPQKEKDGTRIARKRIHSRRVMTAMFGVKIFEAPVDRAL